MEEKKSGGIKGFFNTAAHWILPCIFVHIGLFALGFEPVLHATGALIGDMFGTFDWGQGFADFVGLDMSADPHAGHNHGALNNALAHATPQPTPTHGW